MRVLNVVSAMVRSQRMQPWRNGLLVLSAALAASALAAAAPDPCATLLADNLRPSVLPQQAALPRWSLQQRMAEHRVPGVAVAVIRDGRLAHACGYGLRTAGVSTQVVDADTLFSVGSVSKVIAAAATLRDVAAGRLALDHSVNDYLTSWKIPTSDGFDPATVNLRMLMSHTAGMTVWGFADYQPGEPLPTLRQTLDGASPAKNAPIRLEATPGSRMRYSGGGVTVEQQVLQDVHRSDFETIARRLVFAPIGMSRSTFTNPLPANTANVAHAHDKDGNPVALPTGWETFPEQAASGLWTNAHELGSFVAALLSAHAGRGTFLPQPLMVQMLTEVAPSQHGLGPRLEGEGLTRVFHHGGSNDSYRAWMEGYPASGDGFVILTNAANGGALAAEIRNALTDAIGNGSNPLLRTQPLPATTLAEFAGSYQLQDDIPIEISGNLFGYFDHPNLQVSASADGITLSDADRKRALLPISPSRFVNPLGDTSQPRYEFLRDGHGRVHALRVQRDGGQLYFRRQPAG